MAQSKDKRRQSRPSPAPVSASLYERYKDALRRGHVAALRGRNEAAVDAYGEAASIAPDRALPHVSIGGILVKMNRLEDAVASYERAIALAPRDEGALRGLAEVHVRTGQRAEAAAALDRLADSLDAAGRLADATDAARRALELAESRTRRKQVESLAGRLRTSATGDEAAQRALDQALRLLAPAGTEAVAEPEPEPEIEPEPEPEAGAAAIADGGAGVVEAEAARIVEAEREESAAEAPQELEGPEAAEAEESEAPATEEPAAKEPAAEAAEPAAEPAEAAEPEPEPEPEEPIAEPAGLGIALGALAETALYAGDPAARDHLLAAARAHRRAGRTAAALDACDLAIGVAPSDYDVHLLLADLYLDRGWRVLAVDKLLLLGRLADLDDDGAARDRLCAIVAERLADEPRVASLCA